ncbi:helix-turn-helix transcriptional regulator [Paraburkholderia azotifigens]|uniref:helix-turn-helix domain-containing protein n=1 Tax=Paraburkholderia azotifigens TaxID=2057004 RepID=UPI003178FBA5
MASIPWFCANRSNSAMTKIIGLANSCKDCPERHYFRGGTYECLKVKGSTLNADSSIPAWCPLADYPPLVGAAAAAQICESVAAQSGNSLFRSGAKICAGQIRAFDAEEHQILIDYDKNGDAVFGTDPEARIAANGAEPIYQVFLRGLKVFVDTDKSAYENNLKTCPEDTRIVYTAPPDSAMAKDAEMTLNLPPAMTPFGMLVRALRIVAGTTLYDMAKHLGCTPAMLSGIEFGRKPLTDEMIAETSAYFSSLGIHDTLHALNAAREAK